MLTKGRPSSERRGVLDGWVSHCRRLRGAGGEGGLFKGKLSDLWRTWDATSPQPLGNAIFSQTVLNVIRLEVHRNTQQNVEPEEWFSSGFRSTDSL